MAPAPMVLFTLALALLRFAALFDALLRER